MSNHNNTDPSSHDKMQIISATSVPAERMMRLGSALNKLHALAADGGYMQIMSETAQQPAEQPDPAAGRLATGGSVSYSEALEA